MNAAAVARALLRDRKGKLHVIGEFSLLSSQVSESVGPLGDASLVQPLGWPVFAESEHQVFDLSSRLFHRGAWYRGEETRRHWSQPELEEAAAAR
jgi:hypothetical protein